MKAQEEKSNFLNQSEIESIAESEAIAFAGFLIEKQKLIYNQIEGEFFGINREPKEELSELYSLFKESTK